MPCALGCMERNAAADSLHHHQAERLAALHDLRVLDTPVRMLSKLVCAHQSLKNLLAVARAAH
jgi:hypothetical protein